MTSKNGKKFTIFYYFLIKNSAYVVVLSLLGRYCAKARMAISVYLFTARQKNVIKS